MGYIIYNTSTGKIRMTTSVDDLNIANELKESGESVLEGSADITSEKIDVTTDPHSIVSHITLLDTMVFLRQQRDGRLKDSDWTQVPDSPLSDSKKTEWQTYRQALRDLPTNYSNSDAIEDINFPTPPT
tara:strand:+ start:4286 stop:4672 length:387 start_codon:yes stop_codon:yes gene_type:complete